MTDTQNIYTLIGTFKNNQFTTLNGEVYPCITYKKIRRELDKDNNKILAVNLKYTPAIEEWTIFQYVIFADKEVS